MPGELPLLYGDLAGWFHLLTPPEDYAEEAAWYRDRLLPIVGPDASLLELGCGGGNNASHLKTWFRCTLTDLAPAMLAQSRSLNPECEHLPGDMRSLRLGRAFDAVLLHDAVSYLTTEADLRLALETAFRHCRPGGAVLIATDFVRESFQPGTETGGGDDGSGRALRYLEWTWDPDPADTSYLIDFAYLLREGGEVRVAQDRHRCGLFPRATWRRLLAASGFAERAVPAAERSAVGEVFLAVRP